MSECLNNFRIRRFRILCACAPSLHNNTTQVSSTRARDFLFTIIL
jgi:hypothetical protein